MLFLIAGIALCIWGYLGTAIRSFQICGPASIALGVLLYIVGCALCCKEYPEYDVRQQQAQRKETVVQAIKTLRQPAVVQWIQGEPDVYEDFKNLAVQVLNG